MTGSTASPRLESEHHITSLDGVRGVAISLVLMEHLLWANSQTGYHFWDFVGKVRSAGWLGVDLFFALSGFLITGILFDTLHSKHYFKNFYARRMLRIFPLYYGVILVLFIVLHPTTFAQGRPLFLLLVYLQNTPLWWNGINPRLAVELTNHLWSLAVEEQFYLVWPIIIFLVRSRQKLMWVALVLAATAPITRAVLLAHGAPFGAVYNLTICRADSLLSGAWLALAVRGNLKATVLRFATPVFVVVLLLCVTIAWKTGNFDWQVNRTISLYGYSVIAIGSTAFLAMSLRFQSLVARTMDLSFLRFLGKYSYGIYIFHHIVNIGVEATISPVLRGATQSKLLFHLVILLIEVFLTLSLAWLSYRFYETPFLKLKRYFKYSPRPSHSKILTSAS
jgi:peptidoglycan/LPS O-acetylase OafA/YrhL